MIYIVSLNKSRDYWEYNMKLEVIKNNFRIFLVANYHTMQVAQKLALIKFDLSKNFIIISQNFINFLYSIPIATISSITQL